MRGGAVVRGVLFDFDFTIGDSSTAIIECVSHGLREVGRVDAAPGDVRACIGLTLPAVLERLCGVCSAEETGRFVAAFHQRADAVMEPATIVFPEAVSLVRDLRERGIRTGIVSTKLRTRIEEILEKRGLSPLFDCVVGIEDVPQPKPDPAGLRLALERLDLSPGSALYIGDHLVDAQAAARAEVRFIGVLTGMTTRESFEACAASWVHDLSGLADHLRGGERVL